MGPLLISSWLSHYLSVMYVFNTMQYALQMFTLLTNVISKMAYIHMAVASFSLQCMHGMQRPLLLLLLLLLLLILLLLSSLNFVVYSDTEQSNLMLTCVGLLVANSYQKYSLLRQQSDNCQKYSKLSKYWIARFHYRLHSYLGDIATNHWSFFFTNTLTIQ